MTTSLLCVTCHRSLPEGEEYPKFFGQSHLKPDLMNVDHASDEVDVILDYLKAVCEVLPLADEISKETLLTLAQLAGQLTQEAQRRTEWLYEAGKTACPDREET